MIIFCIMSSAACVVAFFLQPTPKNKGKYISKEEEDPKNKSISSTTNE
jgi:hypothetical protein